MNFQFQYKENSNKKVFHGLTHWFVDIDLSYRNIRNETSSASKQLDIFNRIHNWFWSGNLKSVSCVCLWDFHHKVCLYSFLRRLWSIQRNVGCYQSYVIFDQQLYDSEKLCLYRTYRAVGTLILSILVLQITCLESSSNLISLGSTMTQCHLFY